MDDIELTELTDLDVVRQDAVRTPASGFGFLVMKSATPTPSEPGTAGPTTKEGTVPDPQTPAAPEPQASGDVLTKDAVESMIKDALAEAMKSAEERNKALADELAVLKATPIPGQVSLTAPPEARETRAQSEAMAKATYHERLAETVADREVSAYHRTKAAQYRTAANA